jgi:hypothetical protein
MSRALLAHPQEVLHKRHLVAVLRVCYVSWLHQVQPTDVTRNIPSAVCVVPPDDEQVMLESCRGP